MIKGRKSIKKVLSTDWIFAKKTNACFLKYLDKKMLNFSYPKYIQEGFCSTFFSYHLLVLVASSKKMLDKKRENKRE